MESATAFVKYMGVPWKAFGLCYAVGFVRIGVLHKRDCRFTWVSLSLFTTCENEVKRCWALSLSCWSHKTPESNKSVPWKAFGLCYAVGFVRIGVLHKRDCRFTWVSLSLFTTCENEVKRCWALSLSCW